MSLFAKYFSVALFLLAFCQIVAAQKTTNPTADSLSLLTAKYFQMGKGITDSLKAVNLALAELEASIENMDKRHEQVQGSVDALSQARQAEFKAKYAKRLRKISLTPDFVKAANVSLSTLTLSNSLTDYLNDVGQLNNPENEELGVSLTTNVTQMIDSKIFKGKEKAGKLHKSRFLNVVQHIVKSPLVTGLTSVVPVVSALSSVSDLINDIAASNDEVDMAEFKACQEQLAKYMTFYESLGKANAEFNTKVNNLGIRIAVLHNLLRNFTSERLEALYPEQSQALLGSQASLNELLLSHYDRELVLNLLQEIEKNKTCSASGQVCYEQLLHDAHFSYPDFAINQARYVADELEAIGNEYVKVFNEYQSAIERVLTNATGIVDAEKADKKSKSLRNKLDLMEKSFRTAMNVQDVRARFERLTGSNNPG